MTWSHTKGTLGCNKWSTICTKHLAIRWWHYVTDVCQHWWPMVLPFKLTRKSQQHNTKYLPSTFPLFLIRSFSLCLMSYKPSMSESLESQPIYTGPLPSVAINQTNSMYHVSQSNIDASQNSKNYTDREIWYWNKLYPEHMWTWWWNHYPVWLK